MLKKNKTLKLLCITIIFWVLAAVTWLVEIAINPSNLEFVLACVAVAFSAMAVCLTVCCILGKIKPKISLYRVFAITDIIMAALAVGYAIYDINTDTGWFAGIVGALILCITIPVFAVLLLADFIVWIIRRKNNLKF